MFQATRRDELVHASCHLYSQTNDWFWHGYDGGVGLSILHRAGTSTHRGAPLFNGAQTALQSLHRVANREREKQRPDHAAALQAADKVLRTIQARPRADGNTEETLTFSSRGNVVQATRRQW